MEGNNSKLDHASNEITARMERLRQQLAAGHYDTALINTHLIKVELAIIEGELIRKINPFPVL